jgi:amino acid adenylation domain-containing protein
VSGSVAVFPCSASQTRLWLLERLGKGGRTLAVRAPLTLARAVAPEAAERAVRTLVHRHEALRTTFSELDGQPVQRVHADLDVAVPVTDLRSLAPVERRQRMWDLNEDLLAEPFDLTRGPLLRAHLVLTTAHSAVLLLALHHIVVDGWSVRTLHDELGALLELEDAEAPASTELPDGLSPLRVQYADYAVWQAEAQNSPAYREHLRWWQDLHAGARERPPLFGTGTGRDDGGLRLERVVDPGLVRRIRSLAEDRRSTPFAVLLAAFSRALERYTGQDDLVVGTPVAGRMRAELEPVIGFFVNTLPLRVQLADEPFDALVERLRDLAAEAFERQDVPYEEIARLVGRPDRPMFDVMFNVLEGRALPRGRSSGGASEPVPVAGAHADVELYVFDRGEDGIDLQLVHDTSRVDAATAARLLDDVLGLLGGDRVEPPSAQGGAAGPGRPGERRPGERSGSPDESHAETVPRLPRNPWPSDAADQDLLSRFLDVAAAHGESPAVDDGVRRWSYRQLRARALTVGAAVRASVEPGARVGVLVPHDASAVVAVLGALSGGAAYVPLDPHSPADRLAAVADDAGLSLVLTGPGVGEAASALARLRPAVAWLDVSAFHIDDNAAVPAPPPADPDALAYLIYTSGTTGTPKGVAQSHRNVLGNIRTYAEALGLGSSDAIALLAGLGTDAAVMDLFGALLTGAALHPVDLHRVRLDHLGARLAEAGVTVLHCTPSVFRGLSAHLDEAERSPLPGVRAVVLGGEAATRADLEAFNRHLPASAALVNGYGPTECTVASQFVAAHGSTVRTEALPLGRPVAGVSVSVVDDAGRPVPVGGVGQIVLRGRHVALGYWRRPDETARAFSEGADDTRTYRTGDLARVHPGGVLTFAGRADDQVKVRGVRVEPGEIEAVLRRQEGVLAAGVTARSPLTAHLVLAPGQPPSPRRLRRALRRVLPEVMVPARYVAVDDLPLTPSGKIDRRALAQVPARDLHNGSGPHRSASAGGRSTVEAAVAAIWAEVLDVESNEIASEDTFFDFGGHSLLLTQVAARLTDRLGVRLPLATLFEDLTLAELAARVGASDATAPGDDADRIRPRTTPGPYPLSSAQARLWFLEELNPGSATYTLSTSMAVPGTASRADVAAVLRELVDRHESLRTTFEVVDGQPLQRVGPGYAVPLTQTDLSSVGLPGARRRSDAIAVDTASAGFDLRRGPLLRAHLVRLPSSAPAAGSVHASPTPVGADGVLHLALHHIAVDGWSLRLLREEFGLLLAARVEGRASPLPPSPLQYVDYVLWERGRQRHLDEGLAWWAGVLAGAPPLLDLPTCRPRPATPSSRGALVSVPLPRDVVGACRRLARDERATPFMVYLAAFAAVLHRWSGQEDMVLGTPVAGRTRVETEEIVGLFVNSLPLRLAVTPEETFRHLLTGVRDVVTAAQDHQDVPLEEIVRRVAPQRRLAHAPLFQVMFALGSTRGEDEEALPGVAHTATAKFDLSMTVDDGAEPAVYLEYATDLYDEDAARHLLAAMVRVLVEASTEPGDEIGRLPLAAPPARTGPPRAPADAAHAHAQPAAVGGEQAARQLGGTAAALGPAVQRDGTGLAVASPTGSLSHDELRARAQIISHALRTACPAGSVVALDLPRGPDLVAALLAVRESGRALLLLDPRLPEARRSELLRRSRAALVVDSSFVAHALPGVEGEADEREGDDEETSDPHAHDPEAPAYLVATSGSTGEPKLVVVPRRALDAQVGALVEAYDLTPADRVLQLASLGFDVALEEILPTLAAGATVDLGPTAGPPSFAELEALCAPGGVSVLNLPASYWHEWVGSLAQRAGTTVPAGLRLVIVGSEPVNPHAVGRWHQLARHCRLLCAYGTTETTITNALYEPSPERDWAHEPRTPIGFSLPTGRLVVVDRGGRAVPPGVLGELAVEGECLATGYLDRPDLTAEQFVPGEDGRRYLTGDRARIRFDGAVEVLGRLDDQLKLAGHRIEPGEVEAALARSPQVAAAAVGVSSAADGHPRLVGYLVPRPGERLDLGELRQRLQRELPEHLVPTAFVTLDALPRTPSGKLDRRQLPEPGPLPTLAAGPPPSGPLEEAVAAVWAETLGIPEAVVSATSNFFELGGDSILSLQVAWRLGARGMPVTLADVFAHQTVADLARHLADGAGSATPGDGGLPTAEAAIPGERLTAASAGDSTPDDADLPLTPIQRWLLETGSPEPWHDNQAVLVRLDPGIDERRLSTALHAVVGRHDALRSRFQREGEGWRAWQSADAEESFVLAAHPAGSTPAAVAPLAHRSLNLARGPLLRADLLADDDAPLLLLVAHHLVVDLVSWQILLADLAAALDQVGPASEPVSPNLPPVATSWSTWARRLGAWAQGAEAGEQVRRWLAGFPHPGDLVRVPSGTAAGADAAGLAGDEHVIRAELDSTATAHLLSQNPRLHGARMEDAVVAAVATAVAGAAAVDRGSVLIDVEGHGREPVLPGLDLSRTVGWFTTVRPVPVAVGPGLAPLEVLSATSAALRVTPGLALGAVRHLRPPGDDVARQLRDLPPAQVSVNYLGRLDPAGHPSGVVRAAGPAPGPSRSPRAPRPYALDIVAGLRDGALVLWFAHAGDPQATSVADAVAEGCVAALAAIARACADPSTALSEPVRTAATEDVVVAYPLSPMQEAMLYGAESGAGSGVYVEHSVLTLPPGTDPGRLREAWQATLERHEILRTRFVTDDDGARRQEVLRTAPLPWRVADWRHLPEQEALDRLDGLLEDDRRRGFDPTEAPLMRLVLVRLPGGDRLVWSHHHALLDGWSAAAVLDEVTSSVRRASRGTGPGERRGRNAPAVAPGRAPRPFRDFIHWLQEQDTSADAAHWASALAGVSEQLGASEPGGGRWGGSRLPVHDVDAGQPRARALAAALPQDSVRAVEERARLLRVSPATLVEAAWALVLREYTRSDDVVFGVTSSGRPPGLTGAESMVGLFITTHPARVRLPADAALDTFVTALAEQEATNREHAHAGLVAITRWAGVPAGTPLFESLVVVENYRRGRGPGTRPRRPDDPGLPRSAESFQPHDVPVREIPDVPLSVVVGDDLHLTLVYDARRFHPDFVADLVRAAARALHVVATVAPGALLLDLDVLGPETRNRVQEEWNDTQRPIPALSLGRQWAQAARRHASGVAVDDLRGPVTYAELADAADRVTVRLRSAGVQPGELVGVAGARSAQLVAAVLGVVQAGCAYVPLDPAYPDERLARLVADTRMRVALADAAFVHRLPAPLREVGGAISIDNVLDPSFGEPGGGGPPARSAEVPRRTEPTEDVNAAAYVIYTSGSTGTPKGVVVPHRAVTRLVVNTDYCRLGPGDAVAFASTFSFDASTFEIWGALLSGATLVPIDTETVLEPRRLAAALRERRVTAMFITTAAFNTAAANQPDAFAPLTTLMFGGERVDPGRVRDVLLAAPPRRLLHVYGPTEATTFATWHEVREVPEGAATVTIGRPIANTTLLVLDDAGRPVPPGVEGELVIGGPGLALGYLGDADLTARRFVPHPLHDGELVYRTGDVVVQRGDGAIEIRGRRDGQVKIRGFRIEPGEVETHLRRAPGVAAAVVVPRRESAEVHFLAAYVVAEPGSHLAAGELLAFLRARLPEHLVPTTITILDELPLNPNGKVDRDRLPDPRVGQAAKREVGTTSGTEAAVARIWASVLAVDAGSLGPDQDFFHLGGHSLLLTQVAARLRRDVGVEVPLRALFEARTLRALAAVVESAERTSDGEIPVVDRAAHRAVVDENGQLSVPPALRERLRRVRR